MTTSTTALITGASRGLGRSSAIHLARSGVAVIGTYLSRKEDADSLVAELAGTGVPVRMLQLDVGRSEDFGAFADSVRACSPTSAASTWTTSSTTPAQGSTRPSRRRPRSSSTSCSARTSRRRTS
jgi:NAD(P)-dependent dehydrogenase (short-subunit alcohol dehydrogenase family)